MAAGTDDTVASSLPTLSGDPSPVAEVLAGRYRLVRWLGGGGMGRVYEVHDEELDERVALKVLKSGLSDEAIERFRREVRLTRRIQHKNVARMFDIGEHNGDKFLTMELVEGEPLTRELGAPLAWPVLQKFVVQICEGLAAAHAAGVIHRDLKPDNVLVERATGRVVITDFGIARAGNEESGVTQVGAIVGTPRYMAPEQIAGQDVDHRVDVFSLGVMLYELASGKRPWSGDTLIAIAVAQQTQAPRELAVRGIPAGYVALAMQCLAIDRDHRPATVDEIGRAIAGMVASEAPVRASSTALVTPPRGTPSLSGGTLGGTLQDAHLETSIAVLPLVCAPDDEYLADGVFEDLVDTLSTSRGLKIKPAGIARANAGRDPRTLGQELSVDHVVAGSLRRTPTGLRVAARLIGVADGFQIWTQRVDTTPDDILATTAQLAQSLLQALSTKAHGAVAQAMDPRAVDLFLRAKAEQRRFWSEHLRTARDLFEQALSFAPTSPQIQAAYALSCVQLWIRTDDQAHLPSAHAAVERALQFGHGEAYLAAASLELNRNNLVAAGTMLAQALARAPMSAQVHELVGRMLVEVDDPQRGRHHFETALGLDPGRALVIETDLARLDGLFGNWVAADRRIDRLLADPDVPIQQLGAVFQLRLAIWRGDHDKVTDSMRRLANRVNRNTSTQVDIYLKWRDEQVFDHATWSEYVARSTEQAKLDLPRRGFILLLQRLAELAAMIGRRDEMFEALHVAANLGLIDLVWMEHTPLFADVKTEPRFLALRNQVSDQANQFLAAFLAHT